MHSNFKYGLGQAVVLVTSVPFVIEGLEDERAEQERAAAPAEANTEALDDDMFVGLARVSVGFVEQGNIIGRSEYLTTSTPSYLVRYRDGAGCQREDWFTEDALTTNDEIREGFGYPDDPPPEARLD